METKTNKRIRHIFNAEELYHAFVYRDEYSICRSHATPMTAIYDFLFAGQYDCVENITTKADAYDLIKGKRYGYIDWSTCCIAVINRKDKVLVVSDEYLSYKWYLQCSLPNKHEWKVFIHHGYITNPNIAKGNYRKQLIRKYFEHLIVQYVSSVLYKFRLAYTDATYCGEHNKREYYDNKHNESLKRIAEAVDILKPSKTLLNTHIVDKYGRVYYNRGLWSPACIIKLDRKQIPTINQILKQKLFDKEHQLIYDKKVLYSVYCRGTLVGFTYKQVDNLYDTTLYNDKLIRKITNIDGGKVAEWYDGFKKDHKPKWHEIIITFYKDYEDAISKINKTNLDKSIKYKQEAKIKLAELSKHNDNVNNWRKGIGGRRLTATYKSWICSTISRAGYWKDVKLYYSVFNNTQLRLKDNTTIETSRYCRVPLHDAIRLYKLFVIDTTRRNIVELINSNKDNITIDFANFNIRCGNYKLNWFKYTNKVTDTHIPLNYKEWCICIGCHHIWLDDFIDFVHYYHLEKDFGIK